MRAESGIRKAESGRRSRRGVTLLELIIVVVIFSMLLGFTIYLLKGANRDLGVTATANQLAGLLRAARQLARTDASPTWVVLRTGDQTAYVLVKETVGEWHFEEQGGPERGAFGKVAQIKSGTPVPGRVGRAIKLGGSGTIHCGEVPVYAPDQGVAIELWFLRTHGKVGRGVLATIGGEVELSVETDGHVQGRVGGLRVSSGGARVPNDSWCHVQLIYSGRDLRLLLNHSQVAQAAGKANGTLNSAFVVGDARGGFAGLVDEVRLSLIVPRDTVQLPAEVSFELVSGVTAGPDGEAVIPFDAEGRLGLPAEVVIAVKSPTERREVTVGKGGNVRR
jgi:prepilin-type N-terminal cleavage/methylation domain-containing protein